MKTQNRERKYFPKSKEELQKLVENKKIHLAEIDIGDLTDLSRLFYRPERKNFKGLETWDVSKVTNMESMFYECENFNQSLNDWDVSSAVNMKEMFSRYKKFNKPLDKWDVSNVTSMREMFSGCWSFNQPLDKWDVSRVENIGKDVFWLYIF
ncbi:hypothetical protein NHP21005_09810 [Helicobacter sp. NHP21005]|uniref:BspA family leucine-rich repeat surface protein n=1 Tax=Helicobacter felistomachi TaxID=3040201 RepID=UPI002574510A|nr:BspA family leucine-rich repeat surface protein [Helicobacter sp. NHP21005]BEG57293.1 hypothetical protein NHP21005_09810 [Helicobacter sp. NHP21005]